MGLQSSEGKVSSFKTGNSVRVTPTWKLSGAAQTSTFCWLGDAGLYLRLVWARAAQRYAGGLQTLGEKQSNTLDEVTLFIPLSTSCAQSLLTSVLSAVLGHI